MIERLTDLPPGVDGLSARGKVTREDYERVVRPLLEEARGHGRRLRFLYHFGPQFEGITPGAAWEDARLGLHYLRLFERCAIVSDVGWIRESSRLVGLLMPCQVRVFGDGQWQEALVWLASEAHGGLAHRWIAERGVLVVEPHGPLRSEDFDALALSVDPWIEAHGTLRGLVVHAQEFPGWENLGSLLRHLRFVRNHHRKIRRVALCAGGKLASLVPRLSEHFLAAEIRQFDYDELDRGVAWAGDAPLAE
jgi:hypothetical protein